MLEDCIVIVRYEEIGLIFGTKYSRMDQVKFSKGCLPQILLEPFLNTLSHLFLEYFFNPFYLSALFLYPLKTSENR